MSSKICLLLLGALVLFAVFSSSSAEEENSVSEDVSAARLVREASADPKKKKSRNSARRSRKGRRKAKKNDKKNKKSRKSNKSKKSAKKSKKSGKKSRKNKKKSRKSKKSSKKSRKNKKKKSSKKSKKNRKNNKKGDERISSRAIDTKCVAQLTLSMRRWKDVVTNFQRQSKRITDNQNKGDGKSGKQSVFAPIASRLVSTGGGNSSALTCGGSSTSDGAVALTKLAKDLADCEKLVNDSCHTDNFPAANTTLIDECTTLTDKFVEEATKCMVKSKDEATASDGCVCWTSDVMKQLTSDVDNCKVKDDMDKIKAQLKSCTKAFGACRKLEDEAVKKLSACTADPADLAAKAATLTKNKEGITNVKNKISSLTGSSARRPRFDQLQRIRHARAAATTCAGLIELIKKCMILFDHNIFINVFAVVSLIFENPFSDEIFTVAVDIVNSEVICTAADIEQLKEQEEEVNKAEEETDEALESINGDLEGKNQILSLTIVILIFSLKFIEVETGHDLTTTVATTTAPETTTYPGETTASASPTTTYPGETTASASPTTTYPGETTEEPVATTTTSSGKSCVSVKDKEKISNRQS